MDRVFSVDDIADQFWSPPPIPIRFGEDNESGSNSSSNTNNNSSSSKMMNRSSSEWAFQRFLQEASASNHSPSPPPPPQPASSNPSPPQKDVVEIKDNKINNNFNFNGNSNATISDNNKHNKHNNNNNNIQSGSVEVTVASTTLLRGHPPPNVSVDSEEYQAFLKSRLDLACAAVALTRANYAKPRESAAIQPENGSQGSSTLGSQVVSKG